jgi:hypothetical protein
MAVCPDRKDRMIRFAAPLFAVLLGTGAAMAQPVPAPDMARRSHVPVAVPVDPAVAALRDRALGDDTAWSIVAGLTSEVGPRMDGTPAEARARDWAVARLTALGFAHVHVEPFTLPVWQRGAESGALVAPYPLALHLVGLGNSGATPPGGLTAPVVWFASFNDLLQAGEGSLKGKIAFVSNAMQPTQDGSSYGAYGKLRFVGPSEASRRGAAAIVIRSIGTDHGRGPHAGTTNFAPGVTPIPAAALAVADAENLERLMKTGRPVTLHLELDDHQVGMRESGNVVAEVPGTDPAAGVILIGGHLDSWDLGTGAIDDGAGIAITTAAAKLVRDMGPHRRTIRVVWFGDEETGGFGGAAYARAHAAEAHAMAAESDEGADRVWRYRAALPAGAAALDDRIAVALEPLGIVHGSGPVMGGTDVEPTIAQGAPGIDLNQSALRYFDWHHTPEDTLDRIDPEQMRQNVAAWAVTLALVADAPEPLTGH